MLTGNFSPTGRSAPRGASLRRPRQALRASRLVHVCGVYDALRTKRPYREAWTSAEALDFLRNHCAGAEFDAGTVNAFTEMMTQWQARVAPME